ncbi:MAG: AAA family ATPase, partial [Gemmatimonadetes bacterium]|nr:AAA family ATPase [Gemmatimonadota bacterium]
MRKQRDRQSAAMRVAVTGSHRVGKTTLAQAIADALGDHDFADEPYHELVADGYLFSHPPDPDDFEAQLEYALDALGDEAPNVVFDRCPVDLLAYLMVTCQNDERVIARWREPVRRAMRSLDAVVFVPVEAPDVIDFGQDEDPTDSRGAVDEALRELLLGDHLELEVEILEVRGPLDRRTTASLEWLARLGQEHLAPGAPRSRRKSLLTGSADGYLSRVMDTRRGSSGGSRSRVPIRQGARTLSKSDHGHQDRREHGGDRRRNRGASSVMACGDPYRRHRCGRRASDGRLRPMGVWRTRHPRPGVGAWDPPCGDRTIS